jgi:hypothetical protein
MAEQEALEIDWANAEVQDGALTAPLSGSASKAWREHFNSVLRLLERSNGAWGEVGLAKKAIEVSDLQAGSEADLRHFLESIVVQVNAELAPAEQPSSDAQEPLDPQQQADREMTETVRSFADDAQG